jgi:hypothetical protein
MLRPTVSRGLRPDFYYCQTVVGLLLCGALSDEWTALSFTIAAGPRQRSHSRVQVPWDSRPYFSVSDVRIPFLSPSTTRRATVEVVNPASTRKFYPACTLASFYPCYAAGIGITSLKSSVFRIRSNCLFT